MTEAQQNHKLTLKTLFCIFKNYAVLEQELYRLQWHAQYHHTWKVGKHL